MWLVSRCLSGNGPHVAWNGEAPGYSRVSAGALELRRGFRDPLWRPQERPVIMRVARGPLVIPLPSMPGPKTLCGAGPEAEDSPPVLTWILGYFSSLHKGVRPRLEWGHERALSSHAVAAVSRFPMPGPRDLWLSLESFPLGFPTGLSHV